MNNNKTDIAPEKGTDLSCKKVRCTNHIQVVYSTSVEIPKVGFVYLVRDTIKCNQGTGAIGYVLAGVDAGTNKTSGMPMAFHSRNFKDVG